MRGIVALIVAFLAIASAKLSPRERAEAMLARMTDQEKIHMLHGSLRENYHGEDNYVGYVAQIDRLGIPALRLNDGPQGFRDEEHPGSTTAWPAGLTVASTWDSKLAYLWGEAMGQEFLGKGANVFLGPGMNVARVPVNGRNFEYMSGGDPYLGYKMVQDVVSGVQDQGIVANAKHWVNNNQETNRMTEDSMVDERSRHEIYYTPFEGAIEANVGSFMCSYNKINSLWSCENPQTLKEDLKGTLGFDGWVMSDWGATHSTSINAGLDQEMPGSVFFGKALARALDNGEVEMSKVDESVLRILEPLYALGVMDRSQDREDQNIKNDVTSPEHTALAGDLSAASHVLLKNDDSTLPLTKGKPLKVAVVGHMARQPIIGGGGSGQVFPKDVVSPYEGIAAALDIPTNSMTITCKETHKNFGYQQPSCIAGMVVHTAQECQDLCASYDNCYYWSFESSRCVFTPTTAGKKPLPGGVSGHCERVAPAAEWTCSEKNKDACLAVSDGEGENFQEAVKLVQEADITVIVVGTSSGEGHDREDLSFGRPQSSCQLPPEESQDELIVRLAEEAKAHNTKVVVAMAAPGAILTPWRDQVDAIFHGMMPGQSYGTALASLLFGETNPSGRLPMTLPNEENEVGFTQAEYPGVNMTAVYSEALQVDYRWYHTQGVTPAYAFGHGMSYTSFDYSNLKVEASSEGGLAITVSLKVSNTGAVAGREVPQLYITFPEAAEEPPKQLKGFTRTSILAAGESTTVEYKLRPRDVSIWNTDLHDWQVINGEYTLSVGASSADIRDSATIQL